MSSKYLRLPSLDNRKSQKVFKVKKLVLKRQFYTMRFVFQKFTFDGNIEKRRRNTGK